MHGSLDIRGGAGVIDATALGRLVQLQLVASRRLAGDIAGEHRSTRYGSTLDFADFREYFPGDDCRRLDLHQLARLDVLRIKLYEGDEDLVVRVLLDSSASMSLHGKADTAAEVVAAIGAVTLSSGDAVVLSTVPGQGPARRFRGRDGVRALVDHLGTLPVGGDTPFVDAARAALARPGPPGMTVVVSDLLTDQWRDAVSALPVRGSDLLVVHVLADDEVDPTYAGDLSLVDAESGGRVPVSLTPERLERYRRRSSQWRAEVRQRCLQVGGRYLPLLAGDDVESALLASWRAAGVLR